MSTSIPWRYLKYHGPNIYGMFSQGLISALPSAGSKQVETPTPPVHRTLPAVPEELVCAYAEWTGAPADRYVGVVPPHMFSYWGMALVAELTGKAPYNLLSVLNQGCRVQTHELLPIGEKIEVSGHLESIENDGRRVRIATHLEAHTQSAPKGQIMDVMATVPISGAKKKSTAKKQAKEAEFETVGTWSASANDGVNFALLTGDFNPIHTLWPLARRTRYKGCILHGFGFLSRSYETIRNAGIPIGDFDVRYVKPLPLPARDMQVQVSRNSDGPKGKALRLCSPGGDVHLVGHFKQAPKSLKLGDQ